MEISDDETVEHDVEFRELDCEPASPQTETLTDRRSEYDREELARVAPEEQNPPLMGAANDEELFVPEPLYGDDDEEVEGQAATPRGERMLVPVELQQGGERAKPDEPLAMGSEENSEIDELPRVPASSRKGAGKRKKRKGKNPFISFFLSMYSRRPRQRAADVARQAGRQWGRMSDSQRKLYTEQRDLQQPRSRMP